MRSEMDLDSLMELTAGLAVRAGEITLEHFGDAAVERKGDGSEVTAADRASEAFLQQSIRERFPDDGILGEEGTSVHGRSGRRWVIDPIDGTRSFAAGVPLYGVLIALQVEGAPVLGCCHLPGLGQTLIAAQGAGAWLNGVRTGVSAIDELSEARVVTSGLEYWRDWATDAGREGWETLVRRTRFTRTWGDCYGYVLVATGRAEIFADVACGAEWDYTAMVPILAEAGGRYTSLGGESMRAWRSSLATNGRVHEAAMACWPARRAGDAAVQIPAIAARQET